MNQLHLTGPLGQRISVECTDYADSLSKMREWGAKGFVSGEIPAGGYQLPYSMADTFDWALIGARKWTTPEGEDVVLHGGKSYKRRDLEANPRKSMPAVIKYSRGAKSSDPEHLKEGEDGGFQYVTLAVFRGDRQSIPDYEVPAQRRQPQQRAQSHQEPPTLQGIGEERASRLETACAGLLAATKFEGRSILDIARRVLKLPELVTLADLTEQQGKDLHTRCKAEADKNAA
ncbi:single-stranded DNA-binding protein [Deinococcus wulumuqiensis]|uniref:Single-stranded DNA-binding protein n=1 Tax=Deinococcus wulumuqiensis TaxID=980427 RepID=A0AAV4K6Z8_9DEIO|nr:single-stranded DNA-binding protein [Deinococcus wulumuqiensis]QII20008.1 single-stranded DNA-binding protein [Deinococcus wulumuqiensis R12]GGI86902.1 hypothetical protein GCM10010914_21690 [Deinococcus wulumuqiensis]GGP29942.1 hypothetical protein GCM10008021_15930 [Deinococcus wulumuqiensis]